MSEQIEELKSFKKEDVLLAKSNTYLNSSLKYVLSACIASFIFGYHVSVLNTIKNHIAIDFEWCKSHNNTNKLTCDENTILSSFLLVSIFVGAVIGSGFSAYLVKYGRRFSLLVIYYFQIFLAILTVLTKHFNTILFARLLAGFSVGLITVSVPLYISEMTPKDKKGAYGVLHQLFITIGIMIAILLGLVIGKPVGNNLSNFEKLWWRLMLSLPGFISAIGIFTLSTFFKEETPYYLYEHGKVEEAKAILKKINNSDDVDDALNAIKEAIEQNEQAKLRSLSLFNALKISSYRYVIILGCILSAFQQFTGINILVANSNELYDKLFDDNTITLLSTIMAFINCIMTLPAIYIVEKLGRKTLLLLGCGTIIVAYVPAAIANVINQDSSFVKYLSLSSTFLMIIAFAVSYGPVLWVYLHEMFPSEIKDSAATLASLINWLCAIMIILPSDVLIKNHLSILFIIFAGMSIVTFLFILIFIKETKGMEIGLSPYITLEERQIYTNKQISKKDIPNV